METAASPTSKEEKKVAAMVNLLRTLIPLFSTVAWLLALANSQTTSIYYFNGSPPSPLTFQGGAHFDSGNSLLRLIETDDSGTPKSWSSGRVLHTSPVKFWGSDGEVDFQTTIRFIITRTGDSRPDGLAFFIGPVDYENPAAGGNLGIYDPWGNSNPIFAVEFDIYQNTWDPGYPHVGINIGTHASNNLTRVDNVLVGQEVTALIRYVQARRAITVCVTVGSKSFDIGYEYDLKAILPQQVQVGLSAATGDNGRNQAHHDVVAWYFTSTYVHSVAAKEGIRQVI